MPTSSNVVVRVETLEGSLYRFPDVAPGTLEGVLPVSGRVPEGAPTLLVINVSHASLSIPFRLVKRVWIGDQTVWERGDARPV